MPLATQLFLFAVIAYFATGFAWLRRETRVRRPAAAMGPDRLERMLLISNIVCFGGVFAAAVAMRLTT